MTKLRKNNQMVCGGGVWKTERADPTSGALVIASGAVSVHFDHQLGCLVPLEVVALN